MNSSPPKSLGQRAWKPLLVLGCVTLIAILAYVGPGWIPGAGGKSQEFVLYKVSRADLPIAVTERGSLESQLETVIRCEVENASVDRTGNSGTQIIFIVPNGSAVNEGDLLVELNSAPIRDRLDAQQLAYDKAVSLRIQGQARYDNQVTQNETLESQAILKVDLAKLNLEMYMDGDSGTFKLALEDIARQLDESKNKILEAQAALQLEKTEKSGIEALFKLGYRGKSDLEQSRFRFMQAEDRLASAVNQLSTFQATRQRLEDYEFRMQKLQLEGDVATAERSLKQVKIDNESELAQRLALKIEAEKGEEKELERLDKLKDQLTLCKIYAPHDGMVVYDRENDRYGSETDIAEGVTVRERQRILSLPDLSQMQVKTQIHEAVLDQIHSGLPVTVKVDAFPNRAYTGAVHEVAVVPSANYYTSVKTYDCVIRISERVENLKPGMTAAVDIHVERIKDVLAVPVQAIVQMEKKSWCYIETASGVERREVELGRSNDKFVHILNGLDVDSQVVLNPMSIVEKTRQETGDIAPDSGAPEAPAETLANDAAKASQPSAAVANAADTESKANPSVRPRGKGKSKAAVAESETPTPTVGGE